jgi:glycine oxidase
MKVIIVGAGIAGLAIGWRLAQAGATVEIFDRGLAGRGATWASAGMLAPGAELGPEASPVARFAHDSLAAWPAFAAELRSASGSDLGFREDGSLIVAWNETTARRMKEQAAGEASWLSPSEVLKRESMLAANVMGALFVAGDAQVDNRALSEALRAVLARSNSSLHENCSVEALIVEHGRAKGIITTGGAVHADRIVLAPGAWLNRIEGVPPATLPKVKPVKGQMAAMMPPGGAALPRALIWDDDVYLVPRRDRLLIGATVEDAGFDTSVTAQARDWLVGAASRLIPGLDHWRLSELWAGLRPKAPDEAPVAGETEIDGLYVAGGQYRNGILFAPLLAEIMCGVVLDRKANPAYAAFGPRRFRKS